MPEVQPRKRGTRRTLWRPETGATTVVGHVRHPHRRSTPTPSAPSTRPTPENSFRHDDHGRGRDGTRGHRRVVACYSLLMSLFHFRSVTSASGGAGGALAKLNPLPAFGPLRSGRGRVFGRVTLRKDPLQTVFTHPK